MRRVRQSGEAAPTRLVHVTTVPETLRFFHGQIGFLRSRGYEVHVVSSGGDVLEAVGMREGVPFHAVPMEREIRPLRDVRALWRLWRLLVRLQPDIVHSHTPKAALLGTLAGRGARVPAVMISIFGLRQITCTGWTKWALDKTTRISCQLADLVWCDSYSIRDLVAEKGICPSDKLIVLGQGSVNGIDTDNVFSPDIYGAEVRHAIRGQFGIPSDALVVGFVGRIVGDKGMHEVADAWRRLRERYPLLHLLLVGTFEASDPLSFEDEAMIRSDVRIHYAGQQETVGPFLAAMDISVLPSYREGFGVANIEAAAMSLPVVTTSIPGCWDSVVEGVTGSLVPTKNAEALAEAIARYCDDAELRLSHGRAGRDRVRTAFRQEAIWADLDAAYSAMLRS